MWNKKTEDSIGHITISHFLFPFVFNTFNFIINTFLFQMKKRNNFDWKWTIKSRDSETKGRRINIADAMRELYAIDKEMKSFSKTVKFKVYWGAYFKWWRFTKERRKGITIYNTWITVPHYKCCTFLNNKKD
jgi:hypothetical protein